MPLKFPAVAREMHQQPRRQRAVESTELNEKEEEKKMKHLSIIQGAACAALFVAALAPRTVKADQWDKKTYLTFSDSVQVPGATLPAGKYIFKLLESPSDRYVVQIFNERENPDDERATADKDDTRDEDRGDAEAEPLKDRENEAIGAGFEALLGR